MSFTHLSWWLWSGKQHKEPKRLSNESSLNSSQDSGLWEPDALKFPLVKGANMASTPRRIKRKWQSREERKIDREYDVVIVPSDAGCISGSESDDSDWSIGWLEPHGPEFQSDDESDSSFAVLVPCYGRGRNDVVEDSHKKIFGTIGNFPDGYSAGKIHFSYCLTLVLDCLLCWFPFVNLPVLFRIACFWYFMVFLVSLMWKIRTLFVASTIINRRVIS